MAVEKKEIIIREIQQWKQSRLLPGKYCDFLLALYSQGEEREETTEYHMNLKLVFLLFSNILMLPLTFLVINFTELPDRLQIFLAFIFLAISFACYRLFSSNQVLKIPVSKLILLANLLLVTVELVEWWTKHQGAVAIVVTIQLITWLAIGMKQKDKYLFGAGMIGTIMVLYYVFI
ncbi:hypothetical protein [Virgibacillus senegalensis]|uniref:hypothetical protein n=1 Tax=Virgibacillus senegalensis TaxID=1499679 RepID=UPI00069F993F|nr:hypothetical protein [Virgibacillus senegalensis]